MATSPGSPPPGRVVVVMGASGAGKSTVGRRLARLLGCDFVEGDLLHPPENVERMAAGIPLDDEHRRPWLDEVAEVIADHLRRGEPVVVACSALRRRYRDRLRRAGPVIFVLLDVPPEVLAARVDARSHEFMPASLLEDQLASLEHPGPEEDDVVVVPADDDAEATTAAVHRRLTHTG